MAEEFVSRNEFNSLKEEVQELKVEMNENKSLLTTIDKKIDVITERISNGDKIDELKLKPINRRIDDLEDSHKWLSRTVWASLIGVGIKILFEVAKHFSV